jgi:tRNA pseudouridine13 synthase
MYKIKQSPDDFLVNERTNVQSGSAGPFAYLWMTKRSYNTVRACSAVADFFHVPRKDVGFAGSKDHDAVTRQLISVYDPRNAISAETIKNFSLRDISLDFFGRGASPISLGDLLGNEFEIVVREVPAGKVFLSPKFFLNYFDEQRFSERNHLIGKFIIKGNFAEAAAGIKDDAVRAHLDKSPTDAVGAIKRLQIKEQLLYVHAYQSWLWNETVRRYLRMVYDKKDLVVSDSPVGELVFLLSPVDKDNIEIPLVGFATEYPDAVLKGVVRALLKEEGVTERDFVIRSLPDLSSEGGLRNLLIRVDSFRAEKLEENTWKLSFFLPKGAYATMLIKQLFA